MKYRPDLEEDAFYIVRFRGKPEVMQRVCILGTMCWWRVGEEREYDDNRMDEVLGKVEMPA